MPLKDPLAAQLPIQESLPGQMGVKLEMSNNWAMEIPFGSWYGIVLLRRGFKLRDDPVNNSLVIVASISRPHPAHDEAPPATENYHDI